MKSLKPLAVAIVSLYLTTAWAEETTAEKIEHTKNKVSDSVKSNARKAEEKVCEVVNGKLECIVKKAKNSVKNAADSVGTKVSEIKNKLDSDKDKK